MTGAEVGCSAPPPPPPDQPASGKWCLVASVGRRIRDCFSGPRWRRQPKQSHTGKSDEDVSDDSGRGSQETLEGDVAGSGESSPRSVTWFDDGDRLPIDRTAWSNLSSGTLDSGCGSLSSGDSGHKTEKKKRVSIIVPTKPAPTCPPVQRIKVSSRNIEAPKYSATEAVNHVLMPAKDAMLKTHPNLTSTIKLIFEPNPRPSLTRMSSDDICTLMFDSRKILFSDIRSSNHLQLFLFAFQRFLCTVCEIVAVTKELRDAVSRFTGRLEDTQRLYIELWTSLLNVF